ncbi:butyrophilin subfamily 3 member A2-like [Genypterus blacodes]|uniref:butyrophilin subfamily 3 member A2-like n=1 Tax=Genypterus blacodes TaxID=154954 RepID=UPI003F7668D1
MLHKMVVHKTRLEILAVLVFHLLLPPSCRALSQLIGASQPVVAMLGNDVILPCSLEPVADTADLMMEWTRPDLSPRFVFVRRSGQELVNKKNPSYEGRTSVFVDQLQHGNISLKLSKVKLSDEGRYRCFIPRWGVDAFVSVVVGSASSPLIRLSGIDASTGEVMLECEAAGWYPEPEVLWLDTEGNIVSAGPTETLRGPDGLYTDSSSVTVDNKHGNTFTCKLQENKTNQTRETQIHVSGDFFITQSNLSLYVSIILSGVLVVCILCLIFFAVWKCKQTKPEIKRNQPNELQPLSEGGRRRDQSVTDGKTQQIQRQQTTECVNSLNPWKKARLEKERRERAETELQEEKMVTEELRKEKTRGEEELRKLKEEKTMMKKHQEEDKLRREEELRKLNEEKMTMIKMLNTEV